MEGASLLPDDDDFDFDGALAAVPRIQTGFLQGIDRAIACAEDGLALFTDLGMEIGQAAMHNAIGDLSLAVGDPSRAGASYRVAAELARSIGEDAMLGPALNMLGLSQMAMGDAAAARRSVLEAAEVNRRAGLPTSIAYSLEGLAGLALAENRPEVAARALAAAAARGRSALPLTPALPPVIDRMVATCRELMGDAAFDEATAEGRTWPLLDALDRTSAAWEQDPVTTENRV